VTGQGPRDQQSIASRRRRPPLSTWTPSPVIGVAYTGSSCLLPTCQGYATSPDRLGGEWERKFTTRLKRLIFSRVRHRVCDKFRTLCDAVLDYRCAELGLVLRDNVLTIVLTILTSLSRFPFLTRTLDLRYLATVYCLLSPSAS